MAAMEIMSPVHKKKYSDTGSGNCEKKMGKENIMSTAAAAQSTPPMGRSMSHTATIYLKEAKYEFLKNLRLRVYTASVISFPLMFYVLFVLVLNSREAIGGTGVSTYLIAIYGKFV